MRASSPVCIGSMLTTLLCFSAQADDGPSDYDWVDTDMCAVLGGFPKDGEGPFRCLFADMPQPDERAASGVQEALTD